MASIKRRPDGKWRARYRDPLGKEHAKHFDRKIDGQNWLNEQTAAMLVGKHVAPRAGVITLRAYYESWVTQQLWETNTRARADQQMAVCPFADQPLNKLTLTHFQSWVKAMDRAGLAPLTIHSAIRNVRVVVRAAVREKLIASDPADGVKLPRPRRRDMSMALPTPDMVRALYEAAEPWFKPVVALAAFAGLRVGEVNGLQLKDIDFLKRTLYLRRQVQRTPPHPVEVRAPKYGSERDIALPNGLVTVLARHVEGIGVYGEDGWFFGGKDGGPAFPRKIEYGWDKTRHAAGLPTAHMHDLRHFYASGLIAAGCDVVTVQRALGHSAPSITLDTYSHLWPNSEDRTRSAAQTVFNEVLADSSRTEDQGAG